MCVVLIFDESVIGSLLLRLFLVVVGLREFDEKAPQSLDDQSLLLVVELFPQARLRNRNVDEVQIQLRHGSPTSTRYYSRDGRAAQQESINQGSKAQQVFERASELWTVWKIYRRFEIRPSRWNQRFAPIGQDQHKPQLALTIGMPQNLQ